MDDDNDDDPCCLLGWWWRVIFSMPARRRRHGHYKQMPAPTAALSAKTWTDGVEPSCDDDECAICLEGKAETSLPWVRTRCGHLFHRKCLRAWANRGGVTCPLCQDPFVST